MITRGQYYCACGYCVRTVRVRTVPRAHEFEFEFEFVIKLNN